MPLSARSRISEKLLADLAVVWEELGKDVLKLAMDDLGKLATIAYGCCGVTCSFEQKKLGNPEPEAWVALRFLSRN